MITTENQAEAESLRAERQAEWKKIRKQTQNKATLVAAALQTRADRHLTAAERNVMELYKIKGYATAPVGLRNSHADYPVSFAAVDGGGEVALVAVWAGGRDESDANLPPVYRAVDQLQAPLERAIDVLKNRGVQLSGVVTLMAMDLTRDRNEEQQTGSLSIDFDPPASSDDPPSTAMLGYRDWMEAHFSELTGSEPFIALGLVPYHIGK